MQLDRPLVRRLKLSEDVDLAARDLVALERTLLSMEGAYVADEGLRDCDWQI